jgi:hypothetical protein
MHAHSRSRRDPREDILRGFALLKIFFDHIPDNPIATLTLIIFGFTDPAELFVILAGLSSMVAYAKRFDDKYRLAQMSKFRAIASALFLPTLR